MTVTEWAAWIAGGLAVALFCAAWLVVLHITSEQPDEDDFNDGMGGW